MAPKRQTLDTIGTRVRARTYADGYVARPSVGGAINDVSVAKIHGSQTEVEHAEELAVQKARQIIAEDRDKSVVQSSHTAHALNPVATNQVVRPQYQNSKQSVTAPPQEQSSDIGEIVKDIQRIELARHDNNPLEGQRFFKRIQTTMDNMFASRRSITISALSMLLLVGGVVSLVSGFSTNRGSVSQVKALSDKACAPVDESLGASDNDSEIPSEEKIPESVVNTYAPPADEPRYIDIPKLKNAKTRVLKMSVDKENILQTPRTIWDTGWYEGSSKPGDKVGSSLIVGHVSGPTSGGVFYNLYRLIDGDEIIVEMGDGTKYVYKVVSKEEVPEQGVSINNYLVSKNIDKPGLTIMTSAGEYNSVTQTYENRLAVFAVREN